MSTHLDLIRSKYTRASLVEAWQDEKKVKRELLNLEVIYNNGAEALQKCNLDSFKSALKTAITSGLSLNPALGHCYLIPRKGKVCFEPSYKGLIQKAREAGVREIYAEVVLKGENFKVNRGLHRDFSHEVPNELERDLFGKGNILGVYACMTLPSGDKEFVVMPKSEVLKVKSTSQSASSTYSPWSNWEAEMYKKTALKRLLKTMPVLNDDMARLLEINNTDNEQNYSQEEHVRSSNLEIYSEVEVLKDKKVVGLSE